MSRRRYVSTNVSTDKVFNRLCQQGEDFAGLLYLLMIPHAEDDGTINGDPEELLATVLPMRRDKTEEDVAAALTLMDDMGLIAWDREAARIYFPASFYKYQTYIPAAKRRGEWGEETSADEQREMPKDADESRAAPPNAANRRYPSPSPSPSPKPSPSPRDLDTHAAAASPPRAHEAGPVTQAEPPPAAARNGQGSHGGEGRASPYPAVETVDRRSYQTPPPPETPPQAVARILAKRPEWGPIAEAVVKQRHVKGSRVALKARILADWDTGAEEVPALESLVPARASPAERDRAERTAERENAHAARIVKAPPGYGRRP